MSNDLLEKYYAERAAEKAEQKSAREAIEAVLNEHFAEDKLNAPRAIAGAMAVLDLDDPKEVRHLYLEWTLEYFVGIRVQENLPDVDTIVSFLEEEGCTEDSPMVFNDLDDSLFYIPDSDRKIYCHTSQNRRYLYIKDGRRFHIRRYYDMYDFGDHDSWREKEKARYHDNGIREAIVNAEALQDYSDCLPGNPYPKRPSLQFFKDCDFRPRYSDGRDIGYVLSYNCLNGPRVDWAIYNMAEIGNAIFHLRYAFDTVSFASAEKLEG